LSTSSPPSLPLYPSLLVLFLTSPPLPPLLIVHICGKSRPHWVLIPWPSSP
jgi:hypothetical protein